MRERERASEWRFKRKWKGGRKEDGCSSPLSLIVRCLGACGPTYYNRIRNSHLCEYWPISVLFCRCTKLRVPEEAAMQESMPFATTFCWSRTPLSSPWRCQVLFALSARSNLVGMARRMDPKIISSFQGEGLELDPTRSGHL